MQNLSPYRLLLVEPSPPVAAPIRALLEQNDFQVEVVPGPADARAHDLSAYALIIVDAGRTNHEGLQFIQWLYGEHSHLVGRVVVISADDAEGLTQHLTAIGICDVIPKPINADDILRAVIECLEKSPEHAVH